MYRLSPMSSRNQFGAFLASLGLTGTAAEVGTHRGDFAAVLLRTWPGKLICVDPWADLPGYEDQAHTLQVALGGGPTREDDYREARRRLDAFGGRAWLLKATSEQAAKVVPEASLDFCYLDGDHREEHVRADVALWWPRLRPGGVLAGHDWICPGEVRHADWGRNVQPAVHDLMEREGVDVFLIPEEGSLPWSFFCVKPKEGG